jgi:hypothetical protein
MQPTTETNIKYFIRKQNICAIFEAVFKTDKLKGINYG